MKLLKTDIFTLITVGLLALLTALFGYSGFYDKISSEADEEIKTEAYRIINHAQLWFLRNESQGGGNRSFLEIDFEKIGYSNEEGKLEITMNNATYTITNIRRHFIDLQIEMENGEVMVARNLTYNTEPVFLTL